MRWTGETMRAARTGKDPPPHLLAALDQATGTVLAQARVADKSNEIPALRELLKPLGNQKTLRRTLKKPPFKDVPSTSWGDVSHGRRVRRTARGGLGSHLGGLPRSGSGGPGPAHPNHQGSQEHGQQRRR